jgi:surfactin synthase thioesterase subunit
MVTELLGPIVDSVAGSPYALFGHSMGSRLAHLAGRLLLERGLPPPVCLVVSGSAAPSRPLLTQRHRLAPADFLRELRTLGGCPEEFLNDPELVALFLPVLRADFEALETYRAEVGPPLPCPITVLRGVDDREVSRADAEAWRAETSSAFELHDFPGGHFFLFQNPRQVAALLESSCSNVPFGEVTSLDVTRSRLGRANNTR